MNDTMRIALQTYVATQARAVHVQFREHSLLSGGAIQENWRVIADVTGGPYAGVLALVIRADSPSGVSVSHGRAQEFQLLKAAFEAGVTVPEPLWLCTDVGVIGRPFIVMRKVAGLAAGHVVVKNLGLGGDRQALTFRLGAELATIHTIRPPRQDLAFLPRYEESPALYAVNRCRMFLDRHHTPHPALEWGLRWLERHAPDCTERVLAHRDFRTGNYMVDEHGLTAILDWEFAGWSDPLEDLGWFCAKCWRFGATALEAGGIGERADFYNGYASVSGKPVPTEQVYYWEVMAHLNWAIIAIQQAERHLSGEESSLLLALTGHIVAELEYEILRMTEVD
ncbi:aminoglycoside phosphotransferase [Pseudomonas agarici]|uniref:Aminoglycoside phosphotransferase n=1 Tax=Pseudomonas agarici TaxID=46677 RepID=A0A0X1T695_PSEAA|nr:phosphotransferase family protein [Pseudomonas agarici]AMB87588.1 aminoglycoside phosphotransferase [Pseudomonas agarici]